MQCDSCGIIDSLFLNEINKIANIFFFRKKWSWKTIILWKSLKLKKNFDWKSLVTNWRWLKQNYFSLWIAKVKKKLPEFSNWEKSAFHLQIKCLQNPISRLIKFRLFSVSALKKLHLSSFNVELCFGFICNKKIIFKDLLLLYLLQALSKCLFRLSFLTIQITISSQYLKLYTKFFWQLLLLIISSESNFVLVSSLR